MDEEEVREYLAATGILLERQEDIVLSMRRVMGMPSSHIEEMTEKIRELIEATEHIDPGYASIAREVYGKYLNQ